VRFFSKQAAIEFCSIQARKTEKALAAEMVDGKSFLIRRFSTSKLSKQTIYRSVQALRCYLELYTTNVLYNTTIA
jgi:hypothetical protein